MFPSYSYVCRGAVPLNTAIGAKAGEAVFHAARSTVLPTPTDLTSPGAMIVATVGSSVVQVATCVTSNGVPGPHPREPHDIGARQLVALSDMTVQTRYTCAK